MKNVFKMIAFSLVFVACQHQVKPEDVAKINGYWEIENVVLPDGTVKNYTMNETYDFFEIKGNKGFRQKVMPRLDGTFETNELQEKIEVVFENGKTFLKYETPYSKWREELESVSDQELVLLNAEKKEYHYKKTTAINITGNGKKAE